MDVGLVCDACSALTPIGVPQCARCGAAGRTRSASSKRSRREQPAPRRPTARGVDVHASAARTVPPNFKFCPSCGAKSPAPAQDFEVETRVGPRTTAATPAQAGPQHDVLRRRRAAGAREAHADPRRRRGRRVVHARRHRSPRGPRRVPDLVPRRSVPLADPRELPLREQPARRARRGLAQRRLRAHQRHRAHRARHHGPRRRAGALGAPRDAARRCARRRRHVLLGEHAAPGGARDRAAAARRRERLGLPPDADRHRSAARATTSTSPTIRSSPAVTRRLQLAGGRANALRISGRATERSSGSPASTCSSTATTCSWVSSYFASKSSESSEREPP